MPRKRIFKRKTTGNGQLQIRSHTSSMLLFRVGADLFTPTFSAASDYHTFRATRDKLAPALLQRNHTLSIRLMRHVTWIWAPLTYVASQFLALRNSVQYQHYIRNTVFNASQLLQKTGAAKPLLNIAKTKHTTILS